MGAFAGDRFAATGFPGQWIERAKGAPVAMLTLAVGGWIIPS